MQGLKGFKGLAKFSRILSLVGLALLSTVPARADSVTTAPEDGFVRLDFNFTTPAQLKAAADNGVLTLSFDRKVTLDPQTIMGLSNGAIASGPARDQIARRELRQFHPAGVRLAARCYLSSLSRRGKNDRALRDAGQARC